MIDLTAFAKQQQEIGAKAEKNPPAIMPMPGSDKSFAVWDHGARAFIDPAMVKTALPAIGPRQYRALTLESFCNLVPAVTVDGTRCFVFVSMSKVVALVNEEDRRERITLDLAVTPTWETLRNLRGALTQAQAIDLLRRQLDATYQPHNIIATLRSVKFKESSDGQSNIGVGKAVVSKSIQAELTGASDIPEDMTITAPIWSNVFVDDAPRTAPVLCCVDVDLAEQKFLIRPKAGQIEAHERDAQEWLVTQIARSINDKSVSVFAGFPE